MNLAIFNTNKKDISAICLNFLENYPFLANSKLMLQV